MESSFCLKFSWLLIFLFIILGFAFIDPNIFAIWAGQFSLDVLFWCPLIFSLLWLGDKKQLLDLLLSC
uniref:Uncharacterized protein n=1 Tax=Rhizophora mucronata TaxID=61149 RepID=A0A2P2MTF7_RHIMU